MAMTNKKAHIIAGFFVLELAFFFGCIFSMNV